MIDKIKPIELSNNNYLAKRDKFKEQYKVPQKMNVENSKIDFAQLLKSEIEKIDRNKER